MKKIKNLSIANKILLATLSIVGISILISSSIIYNSFFGTTSSLVENTSKELNKQIIMNYENYLSDVINTGNIISRETNVLTKELNQNDIEKLYKILKESSSSISSISLLDDEGYIVYSSKDTYKNESFTSKGWYQSALSDSSIFHFSSPHLEELVLSTKEVITVSKEIEYYKSGEIVNGVLIIDIDTSLLESLAFKTNLGTLGHLVIFDEYGNLIFSSSENCTIDFCESIDLAKEIIIGGDTVKINDYDMYMSVNTIRHSRWQIATFTNIEEITQTRVTVLYTIVIVFIVVILVTILVSYYISHRISSPIEKLKEHMEKFTKIRISEEINIKGQQEIVSLGETFNFMTKEIDNLMVEILKEQKAKRKTQFIALQNQINPHFLYNTLDSIVWLSENGKNNEVQKMVVALSKFFRISISTETNRISLKEEVEHVRNYLLIQKIRYHNKFEYKININDDILEEKVLKLSLQPLVENAIYHGISPDNEASLIEIKADKYDDFICVSVQNNGYGISKAKIKEINENLDNTKLSKSIGLRNIHQRLKLYYGEQAKLIIESEPDEYTKITIKTPIKKEGEL
ncbi:hypothetical protein CI105_05575 [Candidatus Izimaplasma bacterium ZiA1]|uniref:sensor histidine kinase n=1 Tax=Candidatus Izimoplasma sp. ZiA1 TaxID=2024899 RepID=UPI000BAA52D6|nr:hypothetical protein CI105_05575 [Candidatus Izimaplasma bacterium ZiA1]